MATRRRGGLATVSRLLDALASEHRNGPGPPRSAGLRVIGRSVPFPLGLPKALRLRLLDRRQAEPDPGKDRESSGEGHEALRD
jgi:hypothetical protein